MVAGSRRRAVLVGWGATVVVATIGRPAAPAWAEVVDGAPDRFVEALADRVLTALADPAEPATQRLRRVDTLVAGSFDLDRIARIALGRYWRTAPEDQRREFVSLFKAYVLNSYGRRFNDYAQRRLRVAAAKPAGEDVKVESYVEGGGTPIRLDWRLAWTDQGWRVLDVMVEGVSLLLTYRNEFATIIERNDGQVAGLIEELRGRVAAERIQLQS
jgi:phospholipid transport system substrate-binding protein